MSRDELIKKIAQMIANYEEDGMTSTEQIAEDVLDAVDEFCAQQ